MIILKKIILFQIILFSLSLSMKAQIKTNLDIMNTLIDRSVADISNNINNESEIYLNYNSSGKYNLFKNRIVTDLQKKVNKLWDKRGEGINELSYSLSRAKVNYDDVIKDGLFGGYLVKRNISISGNYYLSGNGNVILSNNFEYSNIDTVDFDKLNEIENPAYPFSTGKIPSIPFFSGIWEPILALGTAAITIFLFFTVRSN